MGQNIVFDLDGTLITCENKQKFVLFSILNNLDGINQEKLDYWWELKRNGQNSEEALVKMGYPEAKVISAKWKSLIENYSWCSLDRAYEDSLPTLQFLKKNHGFCIIILTSRTYGFQVAHLVNNYGFSEFIDDLIIVNPDGSSCNKGDFLKKLKPVLFVGDSEIDYLAAVNSDTSFVALTRGQRSREYLKKMGAKVIKDDLNFINDSFLDQLNN